MSRFLTAAENVACPHQNVRRDLKKMETESRAVELVLEGHGLFIPGQCRQENVSIIQLDNFIYYMQRNKEI